MLPQQMQHDDVFCLKATRQARTSRPTMRQNRIHDFLRAKSFKKLQISRRAHSTHLSLFVSLVTCDAQRLRNFDCSTNDFADAAPRRPQKRNVEQEIARHCCKRCLLFLLEYFAYIDDCETRRPQCFQQSGQRFSARFVCPHQLRLEAPVEKLTLKHLGNSFVAHAKNCGPMPMALVPLLKSHGPKSFSLICDLLILSKLTLREAFEDHRRANRGVGGRIDQNEAAGRPVPIVWIEQQRTACLEFD